MSIPSVPDSVYKFLTLLGILLFGYGFLSNKTAYKNYQTKATEYNAELRRLSNQRSGLSNDLNDLKEQANYFSRRYSLKNPIEFNDSGYSFLMTYAGPEKEVALTDTIYNLLKKHKQKEREIDNKDAELQVQKYIVDEFESEYKKEDDDNTLLEKWGIVLFIVGFGIWVAVDFDKSSVKENKKIYKHCQSCGRQFNTVIRHGSERDGSPSVGFCGDCYSYGKFTNPDLTVDDIINQAIENKGVKNQNRFRMRIIRNFFESLERWNPTRYIS